ncbi:MAG TPA: efflux RND transporter periplasmic adaptor subunit [Verrucomicrobiae bacterium]|nr:efflux RND transporter periplasmic adaptor subunit [Verrucomicrobiae bacterium]
MNTLEFDQKTPRQAAASPPPTAPLGTTTASPVRLSRVGTVVAALLVIGFLAGFVPRWRQRTAVRAETVSLATPSVSVVSPEPGRPTASLVLPAEVKAFLEAPIYSRANGYLKRWLVDIGAHVEAGQLLAEIDTPELDQQLDQARAQLAESEAALALAKTTAERWADLLKTASVSEQENAEKQADYKLKAATVEADRANVHRLEELQSFERITAPFAGTITVRNIDVGDLITAGSGKELFHLAQRRTLRVYVSVPQAVALGIRPGQSAELTIPEIPGRKFLATVTNTSGAMATDSRTLLTELQVDNPHEEILPGSYAQVRFINPNVSPVLTLPSNTLLFRAEGLQVGVVGPDDRVDLHEVDIGRDFGQTVEVLAGVRPSDRVIVNPSDSLASGTTVRVVGETQAAKAE